MGRRLVPTRERKPQAPRDQSRSLPSDLINRESAVRLRRLW